MGRETQIYAFHKVISAGNYIVTEDTTKTTIIGKNNTKKVTQKMKQNHTNNL